MENQSIVRKLCLILLTVFAISSVQAQKFVGLGDTIVVYIDNRIEVKLSVADYSTFSEDHEAYKLLMEFQDLVPDISGRLDSESPDKVTFNGDDMLVVQKGDLNYQFLLSEQGISDTGFRDIAVLRNDNNYVKITTTDLSTLSDVQLQKCFEELISILPERKNNSYRAIFECNNGAITLLEDELSTGSSIDAVGLTTGTGAGLIKSTWVADFSIELGFLLNKKGVLRYNPYISTNFVLDFNSENNMNVNSFLNLGFRWNQDKESDKPDWLGLEIGYLFSHQGSLFEENTVKVGLNWSLIKGRSVYVSPQLYFTDNTLYPAIRIGIGL